MREDFWARANGSLFTDQYQLSMAQLYFRHGLHTRRVQFDHFFRRYPNYGAHQAGFCIQAGFETFWEWLSSARLTPEDRALLEGLTTAGGGALFQSDFLDWLQDFDHLGSLEFDGVPEGRVVHPNTPLTVVTGALASAQLIETALLNALNFQTLIATRAARLKLLAGDSPLLEFGVRRGHDRGAHAGTRAALIGGADFSSNCGASLALGLPPKGTHAHSLVQLYLALGEGEQAAFEAYAELYPDDTVLLLDTVDTLESGLPNAIAVFEKLRRKGHRPQGVRLDSGDLAHLSLRVARELDRTGFPEVAIVLSNDLDELAILQIHAQIRAEASALGLDADRVVARLSYGVGTKLITSHGDPALGGVYKLVAVQNKDRWEPALKLSESAGKTPNPGMKELWRVYQGRRAVADLVGLKGERPEKTESLLLHSATDPGVSRSLTGCAENPLTFETLLVPLARFGERSGHCPDMVQMRERRQTDLGRLHDGVKRVVAPHRYHVSLTERLCREKRRLMAELRSARS